MIKSAQRYHIQRHVCHVITTMAEMTRIHAKVNSTTYE